MFSSRAHVARRQGASGTPRADYLQSLVDRFANSDNVEKQREIVAHLANFAYDPLNYPALRELNIVDLFLGTPSLPTSLNSSLCSRYVQMPHLT